MSRTEGKKFDNDRDGSFYLFCYILTPLRNFFGILRFFQIK